jgi:DNA-binding MarR family transcriptional regulator
MTGRPGLRGATETGPLEPGDSPGFLLWRVSLRWQRLMTATLRPFDLTHVQFVLLASLWWLTEKAGEQPNQRRLAQFAETDPMMTSQVLRTLETKGLVERSADPIDSRARRLAVTSVGSTLAGRALQAVEAADRRFFAETTGRGSILEQLRLLAGQSPGRSERETGASPGRPRNPPPTG